MKPRVRWFTWVDSFSNDLGLAGWQMRGFEKLEPSQEFGVAHDALEHHTSALGMDAEMMALGSILYGRWDRDDLTIPLALDVVGFIAKGAEWCTRVQRSKPFDGEEDYLENHLTKFGGALMTTLLQEYEGSRDLAGEDLEARINDMKAWIRRGYRRTERVWAPHYGHDAFVSAFDFITREVKAIGEREMADRLKVRIDCCGGVSVDLLEPARDPYDY